MEELRKNIIFRGEMVLLNNVSESLKRKKYPYTSIQRQTIFVNMKEEKTYHCMSLHLCLYLSSPAVKTQNWKNRLKCINSILFSTNQGKAEKSIKFPPLSLPFSPTFLQESDYDFFLKCKTQRKCLQVQGKNLLHTNYGEEKAQAEQQLLEEFGGKLKK